MLIATSMFIFLKILDTLNFVHAHFIFSHFENLFLVATLKLWLYQLLYILRFMLLFQIVIQQLCLLIEKVLQISFLQDFSLRIKLSILDIISNKHSSLVFRLFFCLFIIFFFFFLILFVLLLLRNCLFYEFQRLLVDFLLVSYDFA